MSVKKGLEALEQQCRDAGVKLIYDDLRGEGGLCRLRDRFFLILNRRAAPETRVRLIAEGLAKLATMSVPLPAVSAVEQAAVDEVTALETAAAQPTTGQETAPQPFGAGVGRR
jgi:hypothetical protein